MVTESNQFQTTNSLTGYSLTGDAWLGKKLLVLATVCLIWAGAVQTAAGQEKIRIATEGAYPPFNFTDADNNLVGFDVDIAKALCAEMQAECEIVAQDWDGIIPGLVANKYDAIIASMSITDERKQTIDFTERYYSNFLRIIAPTDTSIASNNDLAGKRVGAQRATVAAQWLENNFSEQTRILLYDTQTSAYADLKAGRIDALASDIYPAFDWLNSNPDYKFVGERIDIMDLIGIGVRKQDTALRDALSAAIKAIRANGTYRKINAEYFPFDIY